MVLNDGMGARDGEIGVALGMRSGHGLIEGFTV